MVIMENKILTICPSYGRPHRLKEMIESFINTSSKSDLSIWISAGDSKYEDYYKLNSFYHKNSSVSFVVTDPEKTITEIFNHACTFQDYAFYHLTNDDFIYRTKFWDEKFMNILEDYGDGVVYGNDTLQGKNLPTAPCISRSIVRALGWLQLPSLTHLGGDCVWKEIGTKIKRLYYLEDVIIEHRHWMKDKALLDETYKRTNSNLMYEKDQKAYREWYHNQMDKDVERIKTICKI